MTTEMFGSPLGFQSYDNDQARLAQEAAVTRLHSANAEVAETNAMRTKMMIRLLSASGPGEEEGPRPDPNFRGPMPAAMAGGSGNGNGPPSGAGANLDTSFNEGSRMASLLTRSGVFAKEGMDLADKVASGRMNIARAQNFQSTTEMHKLEAQREAYKQMSSMAAGIVDSGTWASARQNWIDNNPNKDIPPIFQSYDPSRIAMMQRSTDIGIKNIEQQEKGLKANQDQANWNAKMQFERQRLDINTQLAKDRAAALAAREKAAGPGSKVIAESSPQEQKDAAAMIKDMWPNLPSSEVDTLKVEIANAAKELRARNPGVDGKPMGPNAALAQAILDQDKKGEITTLDKKYLQFSLPGGLEFGGFSSPTGEQVTTRKPRAERGGAASAPAKPASAASMTSVDEAAAIAQAKAAIAKGAPKDKVMERLIRMGINPKGF